ncbi:MAG: septal ring lytic transglycosylase RlpA family protein [Bacteroidota bacterium]|nr:septal ring lytic transglycosylase RlpA family protein [Bacteroidota bacterium]
MGRRIRKRLGTFALGVWVCLMPAAARSQERYTEIGIASYYAEEFHGKRTANGERFSMWAMTAAHRTLPFNTLVRVTNLETGNSVVVRINDAGPFKDERVIDLSKAAAARLGILEQGKARVRIEEIGRGSSPGGDHVSMNSYYRVDAEPVQLEGYAIQVGSFRDLDHLLRRLNDLEQRGVSSLYVQVAASSIGTLHRIVIGGFATRAEAQKRLSELARKGVSGLVFQVR